jgi:hypothetical protein
MENKIVRFIVLALLVIIGRFYDVVTTSLYTPDLDNETNLMVKVLGAGWTSIIITQTVLVSLTIALLYYYSFRFKPNYPTEKNLTLQQFISYLSFNNISSFSKVFYVLPKNMSTILASTGYIVSMTLISVSFIVGTSTTLLLTSDAYKQLYKQGIPTILYGVIVLLAAYFSVRFYKLEYKKYQQANS